jgi:hypothetical protein
MCEPQFGLFSERMAELLCAAREVTTTLAKRSPSHDLIVPEGRTAHANNMPRDTRADDSSRSSADGADKVHQESSGSSGSGGSGGSGGGGGISSGGSDSGGGGGDPSTMAAVVVRDPISCSSGMDVAEVGAHVEENRVVLRGGPVQVLHSSLA